LHKSFRKIVLLLSTLADVCARFFGGLVEICPVLGDTPAQASVQVGDARMGFRGRSVQGVRRVSGRAVVYSGRSARRSTFRSRF
jgi:hypothetical protein